MLGVVVVVLDFVGGVPEDLVYEKKYDNGLKQIARARKNVQEVLDHETIQMEWKKVCDVREKEITQLKAQQKEQEGDKPEDEAETDGGTSAAVKAMRRPATEFPEHSPGYWASVANSTVRRYITLEVRPATQANMKLAVEQSTLTQVEIKESRPVSECGWSLIVVVTQHPLNVCVHD